MSVILEPTAAMGPWSVDVRSESAYLNGTGCNEYLFEGAPPPEHDTRVYGDHAFAIPATDVAQVLAALDQIIAHPNYRDWSGKRLTRADMWTVEPVDGWLRFSGPVVTYARDDAEPWSPGAVELLYRSLAGLRAVLAEIAESGAERE